MGNTKHSRQREAILEELKSRVDHPTAEMIYFSVKKIIPSISLATVYRNLNMLVSENKIRKMSIGDADRYDANIKTHYHMHCLKCGKTVDVDMPVDNEIVENAGKYVDGKIIAHTVVFECICDDCRHIEEINL